MTLNFNYKPTSLFSLEMLNFFLEKTDFWDKKNIPGIPIMVTSMLVTDVLKKCVGDNIKVLVTRLAILVINIHYLFTLASGTNIQKISSRSKFCYQHPRIVINFKSPTSVMLHQNVINITVTGKIFKHISLELNLYGGFTILIIFKLSPN